MTHQHIPFCALVALHLARMDSPISSTYAENVFLLRWLAQAQKQKRFPKSMAGDLEKLLQHARQLNIGGSLKAHLASRWGPDKEMTPPHDLLCLTKAIEQLKAEGWENSVVTADEWLSCQPEVAGNQPAFYVRKSELNASFTHEGKLVSPVSFQIVGDDIHFIDALKKYGLFADTTDSSLPTIVVTLSPCPEIK